MAQRERPERDPTEVERGPQQPPAQEPPPSVTGDRPETDDDPGEQATS